MNFKRIFVSAFITFYLLMTNINFVLAANLYDSGGNDTPISDNLVAIKNIVNQLALPIASVLIFACVVIIAIKIIINHYNPIERVKSLAGISRVLTGALIIGGSLILADIIIMIVLSGVYITTNYHSNANTTSNITSGFGVGSSGPNSGAGR